MSSNELYPIFLKAHQLHILLVGAGSVGLEKLSFLVKSSPNAKVTVVAEHFTEAIEPYENRDNISFVKDSYSCQYLMGKHIVIGATNRPDVNLQIYREARQNNILVNVADNPNLCDFYLGGVVSKGHLKIAISTNGKSPTMAKQLRIFFENIIPEDINELLLNLRRYRSTIKGGFEEKVKKINELTKALISN